MGYVTAALDCDGGESLQITSRQGFLFWQSGMASGYEPLHIKEYERPKAMGSWLVLFFTVGPSKVIELALFGLIDNTIILAIAAIITGLRTKRHFWESPNV